MLRRNLRMELLPRAEPFGSLKIVQLGQEFESTVSRLVHDLCSQFQCLDFALNFIFNVVVKFFDDCANFLQLAVIQVDDDFGFMHRSFARTKAAAKVKSHSNFGVFDFCESQALVDPADHFAKRFLVSVRRQRELFVDFIAKLACEYRFFLALKQQVRQKLFVIFTESRQSQTGIQKLSVLKPDKFLLKLGDRSRFHGAGL